MEFLLDLIFIGLAVVMVVMAAKKGFVKALFDGLSTIIAAALAYFLSEPVALKFYELVVRNVIKGKLLAAFEKYAPDLSTLTEKVDLLIEQIPSGAIALASRFGFDINTISSGIVSSDIKEDEVLIESVMVNVADRVMVTIVTAIVAVVLFVVVSVALGFLIRALDSLVKKIPVVKGTNKLFGALLGVVKAVIIVFFACTVLYFIVGTSNDEQLVAVVNSSKIFEYISNVNPILAFFK